MDWFLYDNGLRHERVKSLQNFIFSMLPFLRKNESKVICFKSQV